MGAGIHSNLPYCAPELCAPIRPLHISVVPDRFCATRATQTYDVQGCLGSFSKKRHLPCFTQLTVTIERNIVEQLPQHSIAESIVVQIDCSLVQIDRHIIFFCQLLCQVVSVRPFFNMYTCRARLWGTAMTHDRPHKVTWQADHNPPQIAQLYKIKCWAHLATQSTLFGSSVHPSRHSQDRLRSPVTSLSTAQPQLSTYMTAQR